MKVLVVDDSLTLRRLCTKVVRSVFPDADILEASDGSYAKCFWEDVDLILLDWNMPGINGYDYLRWLRGSKQSAVPVIVITAEASKENVVRAIQAGATQYVIKPFSVENLAQKIRNCVGSPETDPEND